VVLLIGEAFVVAGLLGSAVADSPDRVRLNPWALVALTLLVMAIAVQVLRGVRYAWSASVIALSLLFCAAALNGELSLLPWLALPLVLLITPSARAWMFADDAAAAPADAPPPAAGQ
jgi:hypothetical protein